MPTTRSRVDCGFGLTMLSFSPMMRLRRVDLPALGFPTTVTMPALGMRDVGCWMLDAGCWMLDGCHPDASGSERKICFLGFIARRAHPWMRKTPDRLVEGFAMRCRRRPTLP